MKTQSRATNSGANQTTTAESLLGWLAMRPMSGYDVRAAIEGSTANFWTESFGQIYPALKQLVEDGLATMEEHCPSGQRLRKEYRLTAAGRARMREWLAEPCGQQVRREELLLKLFFGDKAPKGAMRKAVMARLQQTESELQKYEDIERNVVDRHDEMSGAPYWHMTLLYGRAHAQATKLWCEQTLQVLEGLEQKTIRKRGGKNDAR